MNWARAAGLCAVLGAFLGLSWLWALQDVLLPINPPEWSFPNCEAAKGQQGKKASDDQRRSQERIAPSQESEPPSGSSGSATESDNKYYECLIAECTRKTAVATRWLVIATTLLFAATIGLAVFAGFEMRHAVEAERAHVSGGANAAKRKSDGSPVLVVTINNYGKTPAFIGTVATAICKEDELTAFPGWTAEGWDDRAFIKQWKGYIFGPVAGQLTDIVISHEVGKVIVGRIWYRDIFKKHHSVGFALKTDDLSAVGASAYWEERPEQNLGPAEPRAQPSIGEAS